MLLTNLNVAAGDPTTRNLRVTPDLGKTLAVVIIAIVVFSFALVLYLNDKDDAAAAFVAIGEAVLAGGLGITIGEVLGANAASNQLR